MKCPLCEGTGVAPDKRTSKQKNEVAKLLVEHGYSYREIAKLLGWKSANSVTHATKPNVEHPLNPSE